MRRFVAAVIVCSLAAGCTRVGAGSDGAATSSASPTPAPGVVGGAALPSPDEPIPPEAGRLAAALQTTWTELRAAIARWRSDGDPGVWPPPEDVELLALYEQRIYRALARDERLARRVLDRLSRRVAADARANVRASAVLYARFTPVKEVPDFRIRPPEPADRLRSYFEAAQERFGVEWEVLAAVMLIETRMGRIRSRSSAGAQGPMQFIPSTWESYGMGGDVHDPEDAVMGAANYLRASGAPGDYRTALYHYNPVSAYVTAVWQYAKVMMRDPDAYFAYYNWQVFVRTTDGDVRLSGPGL